MGFEGDLCEGIGLYDAQEVFGQAISPQTLPENHFLDFPRFRDQFEAPLALHGACLLPLCGPMSLFALFGVPAAVIAV